MGIGVLCFIVAKYFCAGVSRVQIHARKNLASNVSKYVRNL